MDSARSFATRAIRIHQVGGPEVLSYEDVELGAPRKGEIRLRHTAIGVNFIDTYHRSGLYPVPLPFTVGSEGAGVVEELGPDVTDVKVGDRVVYAGGPLGSYATHRNYPSNRLVKIPASVSDDIAAASFLKAMTAQFLLKSTYEVKPGDVVVVHAAAGGVGSLLVQWAKHLGATVIGTVSTEEKAALATGHGADHVVLASDNLSARVRALTDGVGAAVVYDGVGKSTFTASLDSLRPRGLMVSFGNASGPVTGVDLGVLAAKGSLYVTRPTLATYIARREDLEMRAADVFDALQRGVLRVSVGKRYALADARQAHEDLSARRTVGAQLLIP
jgi:NADPH2:quinone reductase